MDFAIDSLDADVARLEGDDETVVTVPRWLLPSGAREGDVVRVERDPDGRDRLTLTVSVNPAETKRRRQQSASTVARARDASRRRDPGGDVAL